MGTIMEEFNTLLHSKIHSKIGIPLKDINQFIKVLQEKKCTSEVQQFLSSFHPSTSFEKFVIIRLIDTFKLSDELIKAFFSEDLFIIDQAIKCKWFFKDEDDHLQNPENFIEKIISKLSWSTRGKILKNYGRKLSNSSKANNLFQLIQDTYGINEAFKLLPVCSKDFVRNFVNNLSTDLPADTVDQLYLYYPDLAVSYLYKYFERRKQSGFYGNITYSNLILKLASIDTNTFIDLFNIYGKNINLDKLGKGLTRKLLKCDYKSILKHADLYITIFNVKLVTLCLSFSQIEEFHFALMPESFDEFKRSCNTYRNYWPTYLKILTYVNKKIAEEILMKNVHLKFGKSVLQDSSLMTENFIEVLPKEERIKWAEKQLNDSKATDLKKITFAGYLEPVNSFPLLKTMLPGALDYNTRREIVKSMLKSVRVNGCYSELSQVFSFVLNRLRNDATSVKETLFEEANNSDLSQLNLDQWGPIIELINLMIINDEIDGYTGGMVVTIFHKWIQRRLIAGQSVEDELKRVLKMISSDYTFHASSLGPGFEHFYLNFFNENLETKDFANDSEKGYMAINLFKSLVIWNKVHPNQKIVYKDWILNIVKEKMERRYERTELLKFLQNDMFLRHHLFDSIFPTICTPEILLYELKKDVNSILNCLPDLFQKIIEEDVGIYRIFFNTVRLYSSAELPQSFVHLCVQCIHTEGNSVCDKKKSIQILSFIAHPREFLDVIEKFYPLEGKPNLEAEGVNELYKLQVAIASNLKNLNPPSTMIDSVKKFAIGDYLKFTLGSMLSVLLKTPQEKAINFLKGNLDTPVSYRKHILRLFRTIAPIKMSCHILLVPLKSESNISIRVLLWESIYKILSREKSDVAWLTLKEAFKCVKEDDLKHVSKQIFSRQEIPEKYLVEYIIMVWQTIDQFKNVYDVRKNIFNMISEKSISLLPEDFCDMLLDFTYCDDEDFYQWPEFISLYLCYCKQQFVEKRVLNVLNKIKKIIIEKWEYQDKEFNFSYQNRLSIIINHICQKTCSENFSGDAVHCLLLFQTNLLKFLPEYGILIDNFKINMYIAFHQSNESDHLIGFISRLCSLIDKVCSIYGPLIINVLCAEIKNFIELHIEVEDDLFLTISSHILLNDFSDINKILALELLPSFSNITKKNESTINKYKEIYKLMKNYPKLEVKTYALYQSFKSS